MERMNIYESVRACPQEALRTIQAGKLKGKSDINPMWRIKRLTEMFGPCGVGWRTTDEQFWTTPGANGEVVAWCTIKLQYIDFPSGEWSDPVFGIGGSMLVDTQKGTLTSNDDAYKMAYTDAISVACKALGFAADVYWQQDQTKFNRQEQAAEAIPRCQRCTHPIQAVRCGDKRYSVTEIVTNSKAKYGAELCWSCMKELNKANQAGDPDENAG